MPQFCVSNIDTSVLPTADTNSPEGDRVRAAELRRIRTGMQPRAHSAPSPNSWNYALECDDLWLPDLARHYHDYQLLPMAWWLYEREAPDRLWMSFVDRFVALVACDRRGTQLHSPLAYTLLSAYRAKKPMNEVPKLRRVRRADWSWAPIFVDVTNQEESSRTEEIEVSAGDILYEGAPRGGMIVDLPRMGLPMVSNCAMIEDWT